jgi:hypothetical protein
MDPFTIALATFGVQKLRGKSTKRALRDAALVGGGSYAFGQAAAASGGQGIPGVTAGEGFLGNIGQEGPFQWNYRFNGPKRSRRKAAREALLREELQNLPQIN